MGDLLSLVEALNAFQKTLERFLPGVPVRAWGMADDRLADMLQ